MIGTALEEGCCRFFRVSMKIKSITVTSSLRSAMPNRPLLILLPAMVRPNSVTSPNVTLSSSGPCISMTSIVWIEETPDVSRLSDKKPDSSSDWPLGNEAGGVVEVAAKKPPQKRRHFKTPEALKTPSYPELMRSFQRRTSRKGDSW